MLFTLVYLARSVAEALRCATLAAARHSKANADPQIEITFRCADLTFMNCLDSVALAFAPAVGTSAKLKRTEQATSTLYQDPRVVAETG
jgi:hypothetical protein